jgi:pilus assembly protein CpaE
MADPQKIRVLIVDDIQETRENIRRMMQFDPLIEIIGEARTGREAIDISHQKQPDVVVMDINMPDMDGLVATEAIRRKLPYIQIIILSVQNDSSYMRRAMLAGARDFLSKPPMIDELTNAIRQAGRLAAEEKKKNQFKADLGTTVDTKKLGQIIVVYGPKGGVGCTTIATNLAIALQTNETPAIIVDANLQYGDVAVFMNEQVRNSIYDLAPRADELDPDIIEEVVITHTPSGVSILPAPIRPELANSITSDQFTKVIQYLQHLYKYIIIDTASYLSDIVQASLDIGNVIVLLATQNIPSIKSANLFLGLADASGINRSRLLFTLNQYDKRISISPERVGESLRIAVESVVPFEDRIVTTSINRGTPFIIDNDTSPISKSIYTLVEKIKEKIGEQQEINAELLSDKY